MIFQPAELEYKMSAKERESKRPSENEIANEQKKIIACALDSEPCRQRCKVDWVSF